MEHISVFLNEATEGLNIRKDGVYVDCTLGGGGHSQGILKKLKGTGLLIGIDQDDFALDFSKKRLQEYKNIKYFKDNFSNLEAILNSCHIDEVDGILLDLGVSSFQFDDKTRGFSYWKKNKLDMRMNQNQELDAKIIVNTYSLDKLAEIFKNYGEEKNSYRIAKRLVDFRQVKEIYSNQDLIDIIKGALSEKEKRKHGHPARKVFQALRIEVNDELGVLARTLNIIEKKLKEKGRLSVITFHSLEDRIVKQFINEKAAPCICPPDFPECRCGLKPSLKKISRKPLMPTAEEIEKNPRARSAKLRIAKKI